MLQDLRFACRMLVTRRWYCLAVVVTLALGIGINTTVFTLVNAVLFKPVPVPNGERLVTINGRELNRGDVTRGVSYPEFLAVRAQQATFAGVEAMEGDRGLLSENDQPPDRYSLARVSPGLFGLLQIPPGLGRGFAAGDGDPGAPGVLLISHRVWRERYQGGDPSVIGRTVRLNGTLATIVGVMPEGFLFPQREDLWVPLQPTPRLESRTMRPLQLFALLNPGTSMASAGAGLEVIARRLMDEFPVENKDAGLVVRTFHETYNGGRIRAVFLTLLGAVGFVLLIACANVANLTLSRAIARERELTIRAALGATRARIVRQLLVESILLSCLGGLVGLGLTAAGVRAFDLATLDVGRPYWIRFEMDYVVFGYFAAISVLSGVAFGLLPALRASRVDLNAALKDEARSAGTRRGGRLTAVLVSLQFALTVVLLACAGLMMRSFFEARRLNAFVPDTGILTAFLELPAGKEERYAEPAVRQRLHDELLARLAALPGVTRAALVSNPPGMGAATRRLEFEGRPLEDPAKAESGALVVASPGYPELIGLPVLQGRDFTAADGESGQEAALVTRQFAGRHWPGENALGKRLRVVEGAENRRGPWLQVVGVTGDLIQRPENPDNPAVFFVPDRQANFSVMSLALRTGPNPTTLAPLVRRELQALDANLPLTEVRTLREALDRSQWFLAVFGTLFLAFALAALLMASVGLYGVVAQATARRTREIGIRMALGSTPGGITRLVLKRGLIQLGAGLGLGLVGAWAGTQVLEGSLLVGVTAHDPLVFGAVPLLLAAVGLLACWLPARRAARVNPTEALRAD